MIVVSVWGTGCRFVSVVLHVGLLQFQSRCVTDLSVGDTQLVVRLSVSVSVRQLGVEKYNWLFVRSQ
jgi:hypothetical protein